MPPSIGELMKKFSLTPMKIAVISTAGFLAIGESMITRMGTEDVTRTAFKTLEFRIREYDKLHGSPPKDIHKLDKPENRNVRQENIHGIEIRYTFSGDTVTLKSISPSGEELAQHSFRLKKR